MAAVLDVEVIGRSRLAPHGPSLSTIRRLCRLAAASAGVHDGHVAVHFVEEERMAELNARHRDRPVATDVLAFPIDGTDGADGAGHEADREPGGQGEGPARGAVQAPPRELGDVVICPARTVDLREAIVHGMLHLVGMDHETDHGEMLATQARLLAEADR